MSSAKGCPSARSILPFSKLSMRIFGPERSARMPTERPTLRAASRTAMMRRRCSSLPPCEKFTRATSRPARTMASSVAGSSVAGPRVATILVRRRKASALVTALPFGAFFQRRYRRQALAFHELEEGAAAGRNVGNTFAHRVLLAGGERVAATGQREGLAVGDGIGDHARALAELVELEHTHRAVPQHRAGIGDQPREAIGGVRTDVEDQLVRVHFMDVAHIGMRGGREFS